MNAERLKNVALKSRDEIGIGRFSLIFLGDEPEDRFYKGRAVSYIPSYDEALMIHGDTTGTFALNAADLKRVQHNLLKVEKACIVVENDASRRWVPGDQVLTFGPGGKVSLPGMGNFGGVVAEVFWNGRSHVLVSKARLTATKVNGKKIETHDLQNGDHIRIGKVAMKYLAPKRS